MTRTRQPVTRDPELGPVRWCRICQEWWPDDAEFWQIVGRAGDLQMVYGVAYRRKHDVKACRAHRQSTSLSRMRLEDRKLPRPSSPRPYSAARPCAICLTVLTTARMCHGCAGRYAGPLTGVGLASFGLAAPV